MDIDTLQGLKSCPLFKQLDEAEIIQLMHTIRYRVIRYHRGDVFTYAGEVCQHADIILSGEMVAHLAGPSGRIIRMGQHQKGTFLAPAFLFASDNRYPVMVESIEDTAVLRIMPDDLQKLLHSDERLMMNFVRMLSDIVANLTKKVKMLSMNVREKVCHYLRQLSQQQQSTKVLVPLSRQELADHFGIQRYSLLRCLSDLKEEGAIEVDGRYIQIISLKD